MKRQILAVAVASIVLVLAVSIRSSEQTPAAPAPAAKPRQTAAVRPAPAPPPAAPVAAYRLPSATTFDAVTKSLFEDTCSECHNSSDPAGGLDVSLYKSVATLTADRDRWETILSKLRTREMPPDDASVMPSDAQVDKLVKVL